MFWRYLVSGAIRQLPCLRFIYPSCCCSSAPRGNPATASVATTASWTTPTTCASAPATHHCATTMSSATTHSGRTTATTASCTASRTKNCRYAFSTARHTKDAKVTPQGHSGRRQGYWITMSKNRGSGCFCSRSFRRRLTSNIGAAGMRKMSGF